WLRGGGGADHPDGDGGARPAGVFVFGEALAVEAGDLGSARVYEVGKGVGQAQLGGPKRAVARGAEQPRLGAVGAPWQRARKAREGMIGRKAAIQISEQLGELLREVLGRQLPPVAL